MYWLIWQVKLIKIRYMLWRLDRLERKVFGDTTDNIVRKHKKLSEITIKA